MSESDSKSEGATVAPPPPKAKEKTKPAAPKGNPKPQPPYAVVVLNDDDHTYEYVIETLCRVCGHTPQKAFALAKEIDTKGRAVVWTGMMEVAELKRDQIKGMGPDFYASKQVNYPLGVFIEPMPQ